MTMKKISRPKNWMSVFRIPRAFSIGKIDCKQFVSDTEKYKRMYDALLQGLDEWEARNPELACHAPWYEARQAWKAKGRPEPHWMELMWRCEMNVEIIDGAEQENLFRWAYMLKLHDLYSNGLGKKGEFGLIVAKSELHPVRKRGLARRGLWDLARDRPTPEGERANAAELIRNRSKRSKK